MQERTSDQAAGRLRALVLAGQRADGEASPGTSALKALEPVGGVPMLERVLDALEQSGVVGVIWVSAGSPALLRATPALARRADAGTLRFHAADASPAASVAAFLAALGDGEPVLATAADHALLTPAMVRHFVAAAGGAAAAAADVVFAVVDASLFRREFPAARRTFVPLADDAVSGANLFLLRTANAESVARFWVRAESVRKRPWRLVSLFGPGTLLRFVLRRLDLATALARASAAMGARVAAVRMPFAESAIDVDTPADLALAEQLLAARDQSAPPPS